MVLVWCPSLCGLMFDFGDAQAIRVDQISQMILDYYRITT